MTEADAGHNPDPAGAGSAPTGTGPAPTGDDLVLPFRVEPFAVRGRLVRLGPLVDTILGRHDLPEPVAGLLGEALVVATLLAGALKYDGVFSLQARGDGPVSLVVADIDSDGGLRGYASFDGDRLAAADPALSPIPRLLGAGMLAFTVDQGPDTERYQSVVELIGGSLAECAHHWFRQSEQVEAALNVAAGRDLAGAWRAGGLMVQRMPGEGGRSDGGEAIPEDDLEDAWRRVAILLASAGRDEILDPELPADRLLWRLFHEEGVRVWPGTGLVARCRCTRERVAAMLRGLPRAEVESLVDDGRLIVTCQFCSENYTLQDSEIAGLFDNS